MPPKQITFERKTGSAVALSLLLSCTPLHATFAVGLPLISSSKKAPLQASGYEKLTTGDGPTTHDVAAVPVAAPHGHINQNGPSVPNDLRPLTLHDQETIDQASSESDTVGEGVLKSGVSKTDYVHKEGDGKEMQAQSIKNDAKGTDSKSLVKQASRVGLGPVQLVQSDAETNKKVDAILDAESAELNDLWEATLNRSSTIQFIVQKLQPTSNHAHLSTILTRMLSTAGYAGMGAAMMVGPNMGTYMAASAGGSMLQQLVGMKEKSDAKRAKLSQEEELVMFNMVRDICDRMVDKFREYKKHVVSLNRASIDLVDLKAMVSDARAGQDAAKQVEMDYTLRKQQRDIDTVAEEVRRFRLALVDLAGPEAVDKLDRQLAEEQNKVAQATNVEPAKDEQLNAQPQAGDTQTTAAADATSGEAQEVQIDQSSAEKQEPKQTASSHPSPQS